MITHVITLFSVITPSSWCDEPVIGVITPVITPCYEIRPLAGVMKPSDRSDHARDYSLPKLATVITVTGKSQSDSHEQNKKT